MPSFSSRVLRVLGVTLAVGLFGCGRSVADWTVPGEEPVDAGVEVPPAPPLPPVVCVENTDGGRQNCSCALGATIACYPGDKAKLGIGVCKAGAHVCQTDAELLSWSGCVGAVLPSPEVCNGLDDDCNGRVDENLTQGCSTACGAGVAVCTAGAWGACSARAPTAEVCNGLDDNCDGRVDENLTMACSTACGSGQRVCTAGTWGACSARAPSAEICGNGIDDDCNGQTDETCPCIRGPAQTPWQIHYGGPAACFPVTFSNHGDPREYQYTTIPPETEAGWRAHAAPNISFDDPSTLCGVCNCMAGGDFTFFQTFFEVPQGYTVTSMDVTIANVDDGVQVTIFNSAYPSGVVSPGSYAYLGGGSTSNLASYIVAGKNRIVLTHVDDCCSIRRIANATISVNGQSLRPCP